MTTFNDADGVTAADVITIGDILFGLGRVAGKLDAASRGLDRDRPRTSVVPVGAPDRGELWARLRLAESLLRQRPWTPDLAPILLAVIDGETNPKDTTVRNIGVRGIIQSELDSIPFAARTQLQVINQYHRMFPLLRAYDEVVAEAGAEGIDQRDAAKAALDAIGLPPTHQVQVDAAVAYVEKLRDEMDTQWPSPDISGGMGD
ncbi:hypothetical protein ATK30_6835 [Amycolatopsis echigonensis]|uniref:Uncharacterized protein n=1 Tax=Amycolatopsis echigonensis TaxID=2576905 RepID=A0A2N3WPX3_9PSEU|nr:hypothetical protein [Amycolatopsis niigatensis]PKV95902.1 hypothetical protein ATK30_6835 [Amycolatopsis niigatensis]